ncbi:MAG: hypothetical protein WB988_03135, partial [Candidatus Nitrosopolaris sp.]
ECMKNQRQSCSFYINWSSGIFCPRLNNLAILRKNKKFSETNTANGTSFSSFHQTHSTEISRRILS